MIVAERYESVMVFQHGATEFDWNVNLEWSIYFPHKRSTNPTKM